VISAYALGRCVGCSTDSGACRRLRRRTLSLTLMGRLCLANGLSRLRQNNDGCGAALLAGMPPGGVFCIAMMVAASVVPTDQRDRAVCHVSARFDHRPIVGYPSPTWLGHVAGWRCVRYRRGIGSPRDFGGDAVPETRQDTENKDRANWGARRGRMWRDSRHRTRSDSAVFSVSHYLPPTLVGAAVSVRLSRWPAAFGVG